MVERSDSILGICIPAPARVQLVTNGFNSGLSTAAGILKAPTSIAAGSRCAEALPVLVLPASMLGMATAAPDFPIVASRVGSVVLVFRVSVRSRPESGPRGKGLARR